MDFKSVLARKPVSEIVASQELVRSAPVESPRSLQHRRHGRRRHHRRRIFVLTGTAAALYAGPAIVLSFVLAAIACGLVGLCYAELSAFLPVSGSSYTYTYATLGELAAWVIGWDLILEYAMGGATVAVGWSGYFNSLLKLAGIGLPPRLVAATGQAVTLADGTTASAIANLPAAGIVVLITALLVLGTRELARLNNVMVTVKLTVVLAFVVLGAFYVRSANWHPFIPANTGAFGSFGLSGILRGASIVFFAYIGFDAVSNCAQEARRPQRDMPIGILGSLATSTVLYIAVAAVLTGLVPYPELNVPDPVVQGVRVIGLEWFSLFIELGALIGLTTVILVLLYGQSRIFAAMAKDGLLPPLFARVHPRLTTPLHKPARHRRPCRDRRRRGADRRPEPARGRRHVVRLHPGLRRGHLSEVGRPHGAAALSRAPCALGAAAGHSRVPRPDGRPGAVDLAASRELARDRPGCLFHLRAIPLAPEGAQVTASRWSLAALSVVGGRITIRIAGIFARRAPMPLKSIVMAVVLSGWLIASVIAFMIVAYAGFFGIGVVGLMIWFVSTRADLDQDGWVGVGVSPGLFEGQVMRKAEMSHAERAAVRAEKSLAAQSIRFFKHLGIALTLIGAGGFLYFQL